MNSKDFSRRTFLKGTGMAVGLASIPLHVEYAVSKGINVFMEKPKF